MLAIVMGGSGSGKSAYAEQLVCRIARQNPKYYIATMKVYDYEAQKKVERHRFLRNGKGFITVEQPTDIDRINVSHGVALLECMSNLVANEMFTDDGIVSAEVVADKICEGIKILSEKLDDIVIVTNNVFEDGVEYDQTTMEYIRTMGIVNCRIAQIADTVTEVVVGIPVPVKKMAGEF